jgi:hypothetical protein
MTDDIHSCGPLCKRPGCAKADTTPSVSGLAATKPWDRSKELPTIPADVRPYLAGTRGNPDLYSAHQVRLMLAAAQQAQQPAEASEHDADRLNAAYESGASNARQGVQEVTAGFDDLPFDGCPESWVEKPFARIRWFHDSGDASVGQPPQSGWTLSEDQSGTVIATLAVTSASAALDAHWRVVPVELTDEMHNAFKDNGGGASNTWRAVLAAAPLARQVGGGDSERLDWLERNNPVITRGLDGFGERLWWVGRDFAIHAPTLREAIDAARASSAAQGEA